MRRIHLTAIALIVGIAVLLGAFTYIHTPTTRTGSAMQPAMTAADLSRANAALDGVEAELNRLLAAAPKPAVPTTVVRQASPAAQTSTPDDDRDESEHEDGDD